MKKKQSLLNFRKLNVVELNNTTLIKILGGVDTNDNTGNTTETDPTAVTSAACKAIGLGTVGTGGN
jgi:hypothetical protein